MANKENVDRSQALSSKSIRLDDTSRFEVRKKYKKMLDEMTADDATQVDSVSGEDVIKEAMDKVCLFLLSQAQCEYVGSKILIPS